MKEELRQYLKENYKKEYIFNKVKKALFVESEEKQENQIKECCSYNNQYFSVNEEYTNESRENNVSLDQYIEQNKEYTNFQKTLFKMIDERNLNDSDVYNKVHIDRRLFSKIRNDKEYHPSKETVLLLGISLELSEEEIIELLNSASYSLPKNNHFDLIMRFCFIKGIYDIKTINDLLHDYKCKEFSY